MVVLVIIVLVFGFRSITAQPLETATVSLSKHQDIVISTGSVEAIEDVKLVFEEDGNVERINFVSGDLVRRGNVIISLKTAELGALFRERESNLIHEVATLNNLVKGPSELERESIDLRTEEERQRLVNEVRSALSEAQTFSGEVEGLVRTEIDQLFDSPRSNPSLKINVNSLKAQEARNGRELTENILTSWRDWSNLDEEDSDLVISILNDFTRNLRAINTLVSSLFNELDKLNAGTGKYKEYLDLAFDARQKLLEIVGKTTVSLNSIESAKASYEKIKKESEDKLAGATEDELVAQKARVESERERLNQIKIRLAESSVRAPFDGIIGEIFVNERDPVKIGDSAARVISNDGYKVTSDITELDINYLEVGQELEAYIEALNIDIPLKIKTINTTETLVNRVPVYTIHFDVIGGEGLRSGLSADVKIPVSKEREIKAIPIEAFSSNRGVKSVVVEREGEKVTIEIETGVVSKDGLIEVIGDIDIGDRVLFTPKDK